MSSGVQKEKMENETFAVGLLDALITFWDSIITKMIDYLQKGGMILGGNIHSVNDALLYFANQNSTHIRIPQIFMNWLRMETFEKILKTLQSEGKRILQYLSGRHETRGVYFSS